MTFNFGSSSQPSASGFSFGGDAPAPAPGASSGDHRSTEFATQEDAVSSTTIKFNVGGKLYEVSKSLLNLFPDTLLAEKASSATSSPIFIDRDPDRFAYCLDYMRDNGNVSLPETLSKPAFLKELAFFGFAIDETKINDDTSQRNFISRFHHIRETRKSRIAHLESEAEALERDLERKNEQIKIEEVVLKCFVASAGAKSAEDRFLVNYREIHGLYNVEKKQYFIECCDKLALSVDSAPGTSEVYMRMNADCTRDGQKE